MVRWLILTTLTTAFTADPTPAANPIQISHGALPNLRSRYFPPKYPITIDDSDLDRRPP